MRKRTLIIALLALVLPMVLAACGGGLDEGEFADAVEKAFEDGDFGDYNDLVCEDDQIDENQEGTDQDVSVECTVEDDSVECDLESEGETLTVSADVDDDDKACNVELDLGGGEVIRLTELLALTSGEDVPPVEDIEGDDMGDMEATETTDDEDGENEGN